MALSLQQQLRIAKDEEFQGRVALALMAIARDQLESEDDHPLRVQFASAVIYNDPIILYKYAAIIISDNVIVEGKETEPAKIPDASIILALQNMWNYLSGADANAPYYPQPTSPAEQMKKLEKQRKEPPLQKVNEFHPSNGPGH